MPAGSCRAPVQFLADVFGQKAQDKIAVLLEQAVLAAVAAIARVREVLRAVEFDRQAASAQSRSTSMLPSPSNGIGNVALSGIVPASPAASPGA